MLELIVQSADSRSAAQAASLVQAAVNARVPLAATFVTPPVLQSGAALDQGSQLYYFCTVALLVDVPEDVPDRAPDAARAEPTAEAFAAWLGSQGYTICCDEYDGNEAHRYGRVDELPAVLQAFLRAVAEAAPLDREPAPPPPPVGRG